MVNVQDRSEQRKRRLTLNTASSLVYQVACVVCGLIMPRLILEAYGSEVNGLVNSITQFLSAISFMELGVGIVVQSALYKPLADEDELQISRIIVSAGKFFDVLARILLAYVVVLVVAYPMVVQKSFDWLFTATLIVAISISSFAQYYFGVVDRLLLTADQRAYVQFNAQTVTLIANTIACVIFIRLGASVQVVKLVTSLIYLVRPVFLRNYVNRHYDIDRHATYDKEPIEQKWNGVAQHLASVVLDNTDVIVLTLFASLSDVSIYSVYFLVVYGIKQLFMAMISGVAPLLGELWARQELDELKSTFGWVEWLIHNSVVIVFGCTAMLVTPFVLVYTAGITDANYDQPLFGMLLALANACHCLRLPYNMMILSAGHYRQTQSNYIVAMVLNIVLSVAAVHWFGLIGVTVGTLVAMAYQTVWMAHYDAHNLIEWSLRQVAKQFGADALVVAVSMLVLRFFTMHGTGYLAWVALAAKTLAVWLLMCLTVNTGLYRNRLIQLASTVRGRFAARS